MFLLILFLLGAILPVVVSSTRLDADGWKLPADATAVITGGSKGIGKACVEELAGTLGMNVFTCCRNPEDLDQCLTEWTERGYKVQGVTADVSSPDGRNELVGEIERWLDGRRLDVLVNNVGTK